MKTNFKSRWLSRAATLLRVTALAAVLLTAATSLGQSININGGNVTANGGTNAPQRGDAMGAGVTTNSITVTASESVAVKAGADASSAAPIASGTITDNLKGKAYASARELVCENTTMGTKYTSVQEAVNEAGADQTIQMIANSTELVTIAEDKKITLDLNGFVLRGTGDGTVITNKGDLTVTDSKYGDAGCKRYFVYDAEEKVYKTCEEGTEGAVEVKGGCITGGYVHSEDHHGAGILNNGTLNITAGNICGNNGGGAPNTGYSNGGGIMNNTGCTLNVTGGEICCNVAYKGGGVCNAGIMTVESTGKIRDNNAFCYGGVYNLETGTLEMKGGMICSNKVKGSVGGIFNVGEFTMTGGKISDNESSASACGGVGNEGTFTMTGGEVTGNTASMMMGGVMNAGEMTIGGGARITDNTSGTKELKASNLVVAGSMPVTISTNLTGDAIGVSMLDLKTYGFISGAFTTACDASDLSHFKSECDYTVMYEGGCLVLDKPVCELTKGDVTLKKSSVTQALADAGEGEASIKMIDNSTENVTVAGNQTINLDINGCTITDTIGDAITNNGTLTITDTNEATVGEVVATKGNSVVATAGTTNIANGKFNGEISKGDGALNITGGRFSHDPTKYLTIDYAAKPTGDTSYIYEVVTGDDVVCHDGSHGYSRVQWAVAFQTSAATITMVNNSTENVFIDTDKEITLDLNGKTIKNQDSESVITNEGTLTVIDRSGGNGSITGATIEEEGAVIINMGTLYLYAGDVTGNRYGVYFFDGSLTLGGKVKITGNTTNLYLPEGKVFSVGTGDNAPASGMMVGITPYKWESGSIITVSTANGTTDYSQYFKSDNEAEHFVVYADKEDGYKLKVTDDVKVMLTADPEGIAEVKIYNATTGLEIEDPTHIHYGTMVTIKATSAEQGYAFKGWYNADDSMFSGKYEYTFKATQNLNLTAKFTDAVIWVRVKKGN